MMFGRQSPNAEAADTLNGHVAEVLNDPRMTEDLRRIVSAVGDQATWEAGEYRS